MSKFLSVLALAGGIWLIYLGYERQLSLAGKADRTLSRLGAAIDGGDHTPTHTKYYIAGTVLALGGVFGLGIIKK
jgi:threonine/homoserine/homoserine lactone efflux protein